MLFVLSLGKSMLCEKKKEKIPLNEQFYVAQG